MTPQQIVIQVAKWFPNAVFYHPTAEKIVALTIDDVPTPNDPDDRSTQLILDAIAQHNRFIQNPRDRVRGTFFIISDHLSADSTILERILNHGHEIGNHGTVDQTAALITTTGFIQQINDCHQRLAQGCAQPIRWYRPGRGFYTASMLTALRAFPGYQPQFALASMIPIDTFESTNTPEFTIRYVSQFIFPGAILLLHGGTAAVSAKTAIALTGILQELQSRNYRVVTLSELCQI